MPPSTPLLRPRSYFERFDRPSLARGAGFVTANAVLLPVVLWWFVGTALGRLDAPQADLQRARNSVTGEIVFVFFAVFFGWVLLAAFFHLFVWFADGSSGFGTTLAVVGEAEVVTLLTLPVVVVVFQSLLGQLPSDPEAAAAFMRRAANRQQPSLLVVSLVGTVWRAVVTGYGLAEGHDMPTEKALALAFVVGILGFLLNLA